MKRLTPYYIWLFGTLTALQGLLVSCDDYDRFSTDPSYALWFPEDTISFDTVLTTVGSATRTLKVYNPQSEGIRIASVRLEGGSESLFRVNVDGEPLLRENGSAGYDFEVRGGDSLYVRVEVTLPDHNSDAVFHVVDKLIFRLGNGRVQELALTASGQDAYHWRGKTVGEDTVLTAGRPFVVHDSLVVAEGATLTLCRGVQLYFHEEADLRVYGTLKVLGTMDSAVVFRGDRTDRLFDYLPYDNTPSRWGGICLHAGSTDNEFYYADIHSASYGIVADGQRDDGSWKIRMENSMLHNIGGVGLMLTACRAQFVNTQISNTLGDCVWQTGGWSEFVHCTLAQFYPWEAGRGEALFLSNLLGGEAVPLEQARFVNCLITGYGDDVIQGHLEENDEEEPLNYYFGYSYLNTVESEDAGRFVGIVYDTEGQPLLREKNFLLFDTRNFLYDFRLQEASGARNIGDPTEALRYPFDRYGVSRMADEGPDAGCYERRAPEP